MIISSTKLMSGRSCVTRPDMTLSVVRRSPSWSLVMDLTFLDQLSFNSHYEGEDLKEQARAYRQRYGYHRNSSVPIILIGIEPTQSSVSGMVFGLVFPVLVVPRVIHGCGSRKRRNLLMTILAAMPWRDWTGKRKYCSLNSVMV